MSERTGRGDSHRLAGWLLVLVALAAAAVGGAVRFSPDRVAAWTGRPTRELADWWLPGALASVCLVACLVGLRFAVRRRVRAPLTAKRAASGNTLVEIEPPPAPPAAQPGDAPVVDRARAAQDTPAFWPADQAVGMGWARASDAVSALPPQAPPHPPAP